MKTRSLIALACCVGALGAGAETPSLKALAAGRFRIGAASNHHALYSDGDRSEQRRQLFLQHFDTTTPENAMKWDALEPQEGVFSFADGDAYADFAETHHLWLVGHTLVWQSQTPDWVFAGATREILLERMRAHIHAVVGHYKGRVRAWDVVNEAIRNSGESKTNSPWYQIIGPDYIEHAFRFAREADPEAELYYNDYSMEIPEKRDAVVRLIRGLKAAGIRIDGVGMQGHYRLGEVDVENTEQSIIAFAAEGLKVMITELDISVLPSSRRGADITELEEYRATLDPYTNGIPDEVARQQAEAYGALFSVFVRHADKIDRVTFWNVTDADSWWNNFPTRGRTDYPLLFDRKGQPKPAFHAVADALAGTSK